MNGSARDSSAQDIFCQGVDSLWVYSQVPEGKKNVLNYENRSFSQYEHLDVVQRFPWQYVDAERDAEFITSLAFDPSGDFLAVGDKSGRVAILRRNDNSKRWNKNNGKSLKYHNDEAARDTFRLDSPERGKFWMFSDSQERICDVNGNNNGSKLDENEPIYYLWADFQSHEPEFDYLKSLEIEEKINEIEWCRPCATSQLLLTSNDKTIKLWKLREKRLSLATEYTGSEETSWRPSCNKWFAMQLANAAKEDYYNTTRSGSSAERMVIARSKHIYCSAHAYHINSISLNSDEETFLSSDDLRIYLWNLETPSKAFNVVDMKPEAMEDLNEVITYAKCHPYHCNLFIHSSSKGIVRLCDLRSSALCDRSALNFEQPDLATNKSFFSEIISSISDVKFSPNGDYILARDYMNLLVWDVRMPNEPLLKAPVHDHIRSYFCELYENDFIFDKFRCCFSHDGNVFLTGSYDRAFMVCFKLSLVLLVLKFL
eukprot:jgi/Galph1/5527/GphlegSOOS_G4177.1